MQGTLDATQTREKQSGSPDGQKRQKGEVAMMRPSSPRESDDARKRVAHCRCRKPQSNGLRGSMRGRNARDER